jgi:MYXO-CTERM domain-containing protein
VDLGNVRTAAGSGSDPSVAADAQTGSSGTPQGGQDLPKVQHGGGSMCAVEPGRRGQAWLAALIGLLGFALVRRRARA